MQEISQIRLNRWSNDRVAAVGDAGYAPSPYTGTDMSLSFFGAYMLADEISRQLNNIAAALEAYGRQMRPYVESIQKLMLVPSWIGYPLSWLCIRILETCAGAAPLIYETRLATWLARLVANISAGGSPFRPPDYSQTMRH